ncbi:MAG: membrane protein insertion efficiency factor YidD [Nocardia sp.]|nr:membrane protein insertion efficiency factor YidD [Nocardia sp.]
MNRAHVSRLPANAVIFVIELYRTYVSPTRMPVCRFTPSCSEYAVTALRNRGLLVGLGLTAVRLAKCAPWHPGGWDPVPERKRAAATAPVTPAPGSDTEKRDRACSEAAEHKACKGSPSAVTGDTTDGST